MEEILIKMLTSLSADDMPLKPYIKTDPPKKRAEKVKKALRREKTEESRLKTNYLLYYVGKNEHHNKFRKEFTGHYLRAGKRVYSTFRENKEYLRYTLQVTANLWVKYALKDKTRLISRIKEAFDGTQAYVGEDLSTSNRTLEIPQPDTAPGQVHEESHEDQQTIVTSFLSEDYWLESEDSMGQMPVEHPEEDRHWYNPEEPRLPPDHLG
jgi:hypothetical protein